MADQGFLYQRQQRDQHRSAGSGPLDADDHARALGYQYDLIRTAVTRMQSLNLGHAEAAWQRRRSDPIAPYVLALLFAQRNPDFVAPPPIRNVSGSDRGCHRQPARRRLDAA